MKSLKAAPLEAREETLAGKEMWTIVFPISNLSYNFLKFSYSGQNPYIQITLHSNRVLTVFIPKGRVISRLENFKPAKQDILEVISIGYPVETILLYRLLLFSIFARCRISMSQNIRLKHENMYVSIS